MSDNREEGWVALLRGINVGGHRKVKMAELREVAVSLGLGSVATYLQSGNLVFEDSRPAAVLTDALVAAIADTFGFEVDVLVRPAAEIRELAAGGVFPEAESERPNLVHVVFGSDGPPHDIVEQLDAYRADEERVAVRGETLWIDYAAGSGRSKLSPAVLTRVFGGPVTARNLRTVRKIAEILEAD